MCYIGTDGASPCKAVIKRHQALVKTRAEILDNISAAATEVSYKQVYMIMYSCVKHAVTTAIYAMILATQTLQFPICIAIFLETHIVKMSCNQLSCRASLYSKIHMHSYGMTKY